MSTLEEIKAATARLNPDDQVELCKWLTQSDTFKARQLAALKRDLTIGLEQLEHGSYKTYQGSSGMQLAEEVAQSGKERLKSGPKNPKA